MGESPTPARSELFRAEALEDRAGPRAEGDVLRLPPSWTRSTYWLILAMVAAGVVALFLGRVQRFAQGPAVIRIESAARVTASAPGVVTEVLVRRGERVEAGAALVRLDDGPESAEERRLAAEFEERLVARLFDPLDEEAGRALAALRAELSRLADARERRVVRAPAAGVVDEVRTRVGRAVAEGQVLVTFEGDAARPLLIALLPGVARPELADGTRLRVEAPGGRRGSVWIEGARASAAVIGPTEARRVLGSEIADAVDFSGTVAYLEVELDGDTLELDGEALRLYDGTTLRVEAPLAREPLLAVLFPPLARVFRRGDAP